MHPKTNLPFFILVVLLSGSCSEETKKSDHRPNIILIVSDDHGIDALGSYGNPVIQTPNIDKLAKTGVRFTNAFCTSASCSASRSVILNGRYGHATGHYGHTHDYHHFSSYDTITSLPVYLSRAGYETARIGKYHLAPESVYKFDEVITANPRNTVEMANNCQDFIQTEKPFFLYFCTDDPHRGNPFKPENWWEPNSFGNLTEGYEGVRTIQYSADSILVPSFLPDTKECREEIAQYYQSVSRIDQGVGTLMEIVQHSGKSDNTIVMYISDNGIAFPGAKTTLYEPGMKLPCIVYVPGNNDQGIVNDALINWADLTPTILDFAGINPTEYGFHGKSFKPVLNVQHPDGWDETYAAHNFHEITMYYPMRVVRERKYKLIWNIAWEQSYPFASDLWASSTWQGIYRNEVEFFGERKVADYLHRDEFELYDIENDPNETNNLAHDQAYKDELARLKTKLFEFQKRTSDPWIVMQNHNSTFQGTGTNL